MGFVIERNRICITQHSTLCCVNDQLMHPEPTSLKRKRNTTPFRVSKNHLEPSEKLNVIYGLACSQCPVECVGENGNHLRTRMREQKVAFRRHEIVSQVWEHTAESGNTFEFDNARVIDRDRSKGGRLLREAFPTRSNSCNCCI